METEFESLEPISVNPMVIAKHVSYWTKIDDIRKQKGIESPYFTTDEEFADRYGSELDFFYRSLCYNDEVITKLKEYENRAE